MRKSGFIALFGATLVLLALAIAATATGERAAVEAPPGERVFPGLAARLGDVASIGLERKGMRLDFVREGKDWLVAEKGDYPATADKLRRVALTLVDLTLPEPKTREPKLYPRLEVEDPGPGQSPLVTLKDKSGATLAAPIVGKERYDRLGGGSAGVYVRKPGQRQSWLAAGALDLSGDAASWLERAILDIPERRIAAFTLVRPDGKTLAVSRAAPGGKFAIAGTPAGAKAGAEATLGEPALALAALDLDDVGPAARDPISAHGAIAANYRTFDGLTVALRLVERGKTAWVAIGATGSGKAAAEARAIERRVEPWIYAIPSDKAELIKAALVHLAPRRNPERFGPPCAAAAARPTFCHERANKIAAAALECARLRAVRAVRARSRRPGADRPDGSGAPLRLLPGAGRRRIPAGTAHRPGHPGDARHQLAARRHAPARTLADVRRRRRPRRRRSRPVPARPRLRPGRLKARVL